MERLVKATSESLASSSEEATNQTKNDAIPDWQMLRKFLVQEQEFCMMEETHGKQESHTQSVQKQSEMKPSVQMKSEQNVSGQTSSKPIYEIECFLCQANHPVKKCGLFLNASIIKRHEMAEQHKWCKKCLRPQHPGRQCKDPKCNENCPKCGQGVFHNSLLCTKSFSLQATVAPMLKRENDDWDEQ